MIVEIRSEQTFCWCDQRPRAAGGWRSRIFVRVERAGRSLRERGSISRPLLIEGSMTARLRLDPLALARAQYRAYSGVGRPVAPPPGPGKIVLEDAKPKAGGARIKPKRSGEPWSDAERINLVRAYLAQERIETIARDHERSEMAVMSELKKIGFDLD